MRGAIRFVAGCCALAVHVWASVPKPASPAQPLHRAATAPRNPAGTRAPSQPDLYLYLQAYVTGYNTIRGQTDATPCIAASGADICGRHDTIACPPLLRLGAVVEIAGRRYVCEDRMAPRFSGRFDINCDKDKRCPYRVAGWATIKVLLE